jgi:cell wall-associated NlpC family hydrolase
MRRSRSIRAGLAVMAAAGVVCAPALGAPQRPQPGVAYATTADPYTLEPYVADPVVAAPVEPPVREDPTDSIQEPGLEPPPGPRPGDLASLRASARRAGVPEAELTGAALRTPATGADVARFGSQVGWSLLAPAGPVSVRTLSTSLVDGLEWDASRIGLDPLRRFGGLPAGAADMTLMAEAGVRPNHSTRQEALEKRPHDALSRGDVLGWILRALPQRETAAPPLPGTAGQTAARSAESLSPGRLRFLSRALRYLGYPYVWGGEWPTTASPYGRQAAGGMDCSGLIWAALFAPPGARFEVRLGRTTYEMGRDPRLKRVAVAAVRPGDFIFFSSRGPKATWRQVTHMGIALGGGWVLHSAGSRGGVSVSDLATYWPSGVAWAVDAGPVLDSV